MVTRTRGSRLNGSLLIAIGLGLLASHKGTAAEVCRYAGTTDYGGHVSVATHVAETHGISRIDVTATFVSSTMYWLGVRYLLEEVSTWRGSQLENVAANSRYLIGGHVVRQVWDDFQRGSDGLQAYRVQAKTLADFRRRHPGFLNHWDPATFGQSWLGDYPAAAPERRVDLDLKSAPLPAELRSPLAFAFYWVRWLHGSQDVPVFLPGFKAERLVEVPVESTGSALGTLWRASLHYAGLRDSPPSRAAALISSDRHLLEISFELYTTRGSGRGAITQEGCEGTPVVPTGWSQ
jgi:hypothetical protein